jgi:hypothetical protein
MTFGISAVAAATIGAGVLGAGASIYSANKAANAQGNAANAAIKAGNKAFEEQKQLQEPFRQGGLAAENKLLTYLGINPGATSGLNVSATDPNYGKYAGDFSMKDFEADPGYAFRLEQGMKALQNSAAAKGLLGSGTTLKGITDYGQGAASQEYTNAFNRYQTNRSNQINPLFSLLGVGQNATNVVTNAAGANAANTGAGLVGAGNAAAAGYMNTGNAINNMINTGISAYNQSNLIDAIKASKL